MNFEAFSQSKYRDGVRDGDDATLIIPGVLVAVLDGATDPLGAKKNGRSPGQFAANCVARECAAMFLKPEARSLPGAEIIGRLADNLRNGIATQGFAGHPSTTLALALFGPDSVRLITIGDSGIRVNGDQVYRHCKLIDDISTMARVQVFSQLSARVANKDELEMATRGVAFLGVDQAVAEAILTTDQANDVVSAVQASFAEYNIASDIEHFLRAGIKSQSRFANMAGHPLGFSALNGTAPSMDDVHDVTLPRTDLKTLELFTDGYASLPAGSSVADWEAEHSAVEAADFHKIGAYRSVKGSTSGEVFDDRSIVCVRLAP
ncbi:MAG TPA: hypothetical protein ENK28_03035 [Aliiroseovarius sp.]|nr:hypothetical protein [Aliiroseovarius sp.]